MIRVVVVEDNVPLAFGLRNNLEIENYQVEVVGDGSTAIKVIGLRPPDLIVLDLMLPGMDGFRVLRTVRERGCRAPVLILTALGREEDKVRGLKLGADDYVTKPFGVLELLARIEALIRRAAPRPHLGAREPIRIGPLIVEPEARVAQVDGRPIDLTPKEFDLLWWLIEARGAAVSRSDLMVRVWGYQADVLSRTVDTHVAELRRKLGDDAGAPRFIHTVRKVGYRLGDPR
jgi:DNA-binding response OmpR family regulator